MTSFKSFGITGLAILLVALLAGPAFAQAPKEDPGSHPGATQGDEAADAEAFEQMLRGVDVLPDRESMEERWPDADQRLIAAATDTERSEYIRWRATSLLGNFVEDHVQKALVDLTDDADERVRATAYYTLGSAFLEEGDDELFSLLREGLDDSERVASRVVRSFGWTDHPEAKTLLEEIVEGTKHGDLQSHASRALERHED